MKSEVINIENKMQKITELWTPKIIEQFNNYHIKLAKFYGDFTWHKHDETDEVFYVIKGEMSIDFRDKSVFLKAGELFVVQKGVEHKPYAKEECRVILIEPVGTINTGNIKNNLTASNKNWI